MPGLRSRRRRILEQAGISTKVVANVLPRIGELVAGPARDAIRDAFITHVIGGKKLSTDPMFLDMVLMPTPDAVLRAVELLAGALGDAGSNRPVIVVDVGGATTDVYSVTPGSTESADRGFVPVPTLPARRTVEADVGVRWSATGIVDAAAELGILSDEDVVRLGWAADRRSLDVSMLPVSEEELALDAELAALAVTVAILRHAGTQEMLLEHGGMELRREGPDLRGPALLVLTGGVFRFQGPEMVEKLTMATFDSFDRRHHMLPSDLDIVTDSEYLLATCGLLALRDSSAALGLLRSALPGLFGTPDTQIRTTNNVARHPDEETITERSRVTSPLTSDSLVPKGLPDGRVLAERGRERARSIDFPIGRYPRFAVCAPTASTRSGVATAGRSRRT